MAAFSSIALGLGLAAAGTGVGLGIASMAGGKKKGSPSAQMPSAPGAPTMAGASATAKGVAKSRKKAMAKSKSIFSSPLGLSEEADVVKKKLLGQ